MQRKFLYHLSFIFALTLCLCIALPFSSLAADEELVGGEMKKIMGLTGFNYMAHSYDAVSNGEFIYSWDSPLGYNEPSGDGITLYGNASEYNVTNYASLNYKSRLVFRIPLMLGVYVGKFGEPEPSGSVQFGFCASVDLLDNPFIDYKPIEAFFLGYSDGVSGYHYKVNYQALPGTIDLNVPTPLYSTSDGLIWDYDTTTSQPFKLINLDWSFEYDDFKGSGESVNLNYLYIVVESPVDYFVRTTCYYGLTKASFVADEELKQNIIISLDNLQTALDAMALMQAEKFDEMIELLQSIADKSQQQEVIHILQDLTTMSPDDPDVPFIEDLDAKADELAGRQDEISDVLNSVPQPDINNITTIIKPSTVINNSDPATVQTALKVIYEWDTFIYIVTIVAALMVISYVIFGKKR